jgi:NADH-quinone oxidoreductase subunit M
MENSQQLTALLIWPMLASLIAWVVPKGNQRPYAMFMSAVQAALTFYLALPVVQGGSALSQSLPWLTDLGVQLQLQLDSTSSWFVLLSSFVSFVVLGMKGQWFRRSARLYTSMAFFLIFAINLAFLSSNLILFYLAYEAVFIPMILMVGVWGTNTKAASVFRFFLMSFFGSILMLVSIFYLSYFHFTKTGVFSANMTDLLKLDLASNSAMPICFAGFFLAFAIKVPLFPFHGWLKEVYVNAPAPATIWMSAILSKLGVYGFIRFVGPLFPETLLAAQGALLAIAAFTVIYSAFLAIQAKDPKALLAYSSISHLGFVMLGVFTLGNAGRSSAILLSISHGLTSATLFYLYQLVNERKEEVTLEEYSGMAKKYPILFVCMFIAVLASVSLPGTFNFVGEFMVLISAYPVSALCTILAGLGVIFGAVYMLKFYQRLGFGPSSTESESSNDIGGFDLLVIIVILAMMIYFGFQPSLFLGGMNNV